MWKWFKRLIVLVIVVFLVAALLIPDKIDSQDQLKMYQHKHPLPI